MIVEAVFNGIIFVILGIINLFPDFPQIDVAFLGDVFRVLSLIDAFVSVKVVSACFATIFVFLNINIIWSVIMWVVRKLPGVE